jgi:chemotaxis protein methyltransferase WspC
MDVSPVLALLRQKIGLNPESIGTESVEKAVRECIEMSGAASVEDYVENINQSAAELSGLVESVLIRETSFFRNRTPFIALQSYLSQFVLNRKRAGPLRILCLPCSTGEEAYSIAMVLLDMKLSADQFFIQAADISEPVLKIAKAGRYNAYSFRGGNIASRKKYFTEQPDGSYILKKAVRDAVHFEQANILDDKFQLEHEHYDVVFCRNLLIYFDLDAKNKAINALARHLSDQGVLFVGHAEAANISYFGFASLDYPMSFAFARQEYAAAINRALNANSPIKGTHSSPIPVQRHTIKAGVSRDAGKIIPVVPQPGKNGAKETTSIKIPTADEIAKDISNAKQLADAGSLNEAVAICEKLLFAGVESAEIYFLLGQVAGSTEDNLMAEEYLKKAIYLNADFHDALIYLSVVYDRMGNPEKVAVFRRRAQRVKLREKEGQIK